MPITGQTALTTINVAKEQRITYQPLLLVEITLVNGSVLRLASENLDSTNGGVQYAGHDYLPRIMQEQLGPLQAVTDSGIIQSPQVTMDLADADKFLWSTYDLPIGFKGAKMVIKFVFWDPDTTTFSSDQLIIFVGICNAVQDTDDIKLTLLATNILNLSNINLPTAPMSRLCPWVFPATAAQRASAADDDTSIYYKCGYSPDISSGNAVGNYQSGSTPFTDCDYTFAGCLARMGNTALATTSTTFATPVQIEKDTSMRDTGRFGGVQWDPPADWRGRAYLSGTKDEGINNPNDAKYNQYIPLLYGNSFVEPVIANVVGDPNITVMEAVLCLGEVGDPSFSPTALPYVIVNDFIIPHVSEATDSVMSWQWVNTGRRNGTTGRGGLYNGTGDCYGSVCCIAITVPRSVADSSSIPTVRILAVGPSVRVYTTPSVFTFVRTNNSVWNLLDVLGWCGVDSTILNVQSFIDAAAICNPLISYVDLTGTSQTHSRYQMGFVVTDRRSAAEILNGLLAGFKAMLYWGSNGLLAIRIKQTLADQQPSAVDGSNDNTAYTSEHGDGSSGTGYVAYHFHDADIARVGPDRNSASSLHIMQNAFSGTPNRISVGVQDQDYFYTGDTVGVVDTEDVARAGQQISGTIVAEGLINLDQSKRALQCSLAESYRGNPRTGINFGNDSGGTLIAEFDTSFKGVKLQVGHLVKLTSTKYSISGQLFRILAISPKDNCARITIRMAWHDDDWYLDSYGQQPDPRLSAQTRQRLNRPPFGWLPNAVAPVANDPIFDVTEKSFSIAPSYETTADGVSAITKITLGGTVPINGFSQTLPVVYAPQGSMAGTGGSIPAGAYFESLCAIDSNGLSTPPSKTVKVTTTGSASTIGFSSIVWPSGTVSWKMYAGRNPNKMSLQASGSGTPSSVTITAVKAADEGIPDVQFDHLNVKLKKVLHSGVFWTKIIAVTATTLQISVDVPFTANIWAGRKISIIGQVDTVDPLPIYDFTVASNTTDTFTLSGVSSLITLGVNVGDFLVMRTAPTTVTPTTIGDSMFVNQVQYHNPSAAVVDATNASPIVLEFAAPHDLATSDVLFTYGVAGNTAANGLYVITVVDSLHVSLNSTTGSGAYAGGGTSVLIDYGLQVNKEVGNLVLIIAGTGRGQQRKILSNTTTTFTLDSEWSILPDSTSVFIVVEEGWSYTQDTTPIRTTLAGTQTSLTIPTANFLGQTMWLQVFTRTLDERESVPQHSPGRELYLYGQPSSIRSSATSPIDGFYNITIVSNHASIELDNGRNQEVILIHGNPQITVDNPTRTGGTPSPSEWMAFYIIQDGTGGAPTPLWDSSFGNDVKAQIIDGTPNTTSAYAMTLRGDGKWHLDSFITGQAI